MGKKKKYKYRYFKKQNGIMVEGFTNNLEVANNNSYTSGEPYYLISSSGVETKVKATFIMTEGTVDQGFHHHSSRKNKVS